MNNKFLWMLFLPLLFLGACSPAQKLERLITKNPELLKPRTITYTDTVYLDARSVVDTFFKLPEPGKSFFIETDAGTAEIYRGFGDTLKLRVKTKPQEIYRDISLTIPTVETHRKWLGPWEAIPLTSFLILLIVLIFKFVPDRKERE